MANNDLTVTVGLNVDASVNNIEKQLKTVNERLDKDHALKIIGNIDLGKTTQRIQSQLATIGKNFRLDISDVKLDTNADVVAKQMEVLGNNATKASKEIKKVGQSLANIGGDYLNPIKPKIDASGYIDALATMQALKEQLAPLGSSVTVTGNYGEEKQVQGLQKMTAEIKASSGEVRTLTFEWSEFDKAFFATVGKYSDKGIEKIQQDVVRLEKELANFKASHQAIESGLTQPLTEATNAINNLKAGAGSVETAQKALDSLKTVAANIGSNLKSTGSSFNVFDNAANKAQNFDNTLKTLKMDIDSLSPSSAKSSLVSQIDLAINRMAEFKRVEEESGRGFEWSSRYGEISSLLQNIANNLKVAQKEEVSFNKEFEKEVQIEERINKEKEKRFNKEFNQALKEEAREIALKEKQLALAKQLREEQQQEYWQGRFEDAIKAQTAENEVLKDMKKYYEDFNKEQAKQDRLDNNLESLANRVERTSAAFADWSNKNKKVSQSNKEIAGSINETTGSLYTYTEKWAELTQRLAAFRAKAQAGTLTPDDIINFKHLNEEINAFKKNADAANLTINSFFRNMRTQLSYVVMQWISLQGAVKMLRKLTTEVINVDTAMTELRKVTEATDAEFDKFSKSAAETAKELGASISEVINATATFSRLGYSLPDAEELGRVATVFKNVGDGITETEAAEDLVSTMKAFNIEAKDSISIVDKFNKVESCPFYILVERNRRQIFPNCWEILKSFSLLFSKRRKPETSKRITYGEKKRIQSAKVVYVLSVV